MMNFFKFFSGNLRQVDLLLREIFSTWLQNSQKIFFESDLRKGTKGSTNLVRVFVIDKKALLLIDS